MIISKNAIRKSIRLKNNAEFLTDLYALKIETVGSNFIFSS